MATWNELSARAGRNDFPTILFYGLLNMQLTETKEIALGIERAWTSAEWPGICFGPAEMSRQAWHTIFMRALDNGEFLDETTPADITTLPETLTLYRGAPAEHKFGMSWTSSFDRAHWFATRMNALYGGHIYRVEIPRELVLAKFHEARGESEYVLDTTEFLEDDIDEVPETEYENLLTSESKRR